MNADGIHGLDDLNALFWQNRDRLGEEEQRLFQAILLELQKGEGCDRALLEKLITCLGQKRNLL
ncbi:MAG TPA: hypothetical protein PKD52_09350 [Clostridiales bacterium]|nr:hypothetical protein [Clostridiales bacterium]